MFYRFMGLLIQPGARASMARISMFFVRCPQQIAEYVETFLSLTSVLVPMCWLTKQGSLYMPGGRPGYR
jgi:hypothetical protein